VKIISYTEAQERIKQGRIVVVSFNSESGCEDERVLTAEDLMNYENDDVAFVYDDAAEAEAEEIFSSLREEVKDYLYMLLLTENNLLFG
jgi:hypothetical protein